jgi:hypothetical protein
MNRIMTNIKPYPHHHHQQPQQQQQKYSVYRPAYHRIPSTPIQRQSKDVWTMSPEISPIVVPSMSIQNYYPCYPTVHRQVSFQVCILNCI